MPRESSVSPSHGNPMALGFFAVGLFAVGYQKNIQGLNIFFRIGWPYLEQVRVTGIFRNSLFSVLYAWVLTANCPTAKQIWSRNPIAPSQHYRIGVLTRGPQLVTHDVERRQSPWCNLLDFVSVWNAALIRRAGEERVVGQNVERQNVDRQNVDRQNAEQTKCRKKKLFFFSIFLLFFLISKNKKLNICFVFL